MAKKYVSFKDKSQPLGKRKVEYVKWLMQKRGCSLENAKKACHRMFYREEHG